MIKEKKIDTKIEQLNGFTMAIWNDPVENNTVHMKVNPSASEEVLKGTLAEKFAMVVFQAFKDFTKQSQKVKESSVFFKSDGIKQIFLNNNETVEQAIGRGIGGDVKDTGIEL